jgi:type IV secretion system protein VirB2
MRHDIKLTGLIYFVLFFWPGQSLAQTMQSLPSVANPQGSGPILNALFWLQGTLLGTVATTLGVIAVASIGFMMLTGRMSWHKGAGVVMGCFILFGATSIVAGIQSVALTAR